ncbi:hypothetical protein TrLO_g11207 [Triparma laevis f. longispina]|uniref:Uncharacterized protein n=1 Tax=Triparma laevis f. longispina TaxID=1714387 RepID=A0A9W7CHI0_9STRA|nr:hypothetical protein TrLO_g11207 [Triparma laevis f. longispina]
MLRSTLSLRPALRRFTSSSIPPPPPTHTPPPDRLSLGTFRNQLIMMGMSFGLVLLGGTNWNLRYEINEIKAKNVSGSNSSSSSLTISKDLIKPFCKEVALKTKVIIIEEQSTSWLGGGGLDKDALKRVEFKISDVVESVLGRVNDLSSNVGIQESTESVEEVKVEDGVSEILDEKKGEQPKMI